MFDWNENPIAILVYAMALQELSEKRVNRQVFG